MNTPSYLTVELLQRAKKEVAASPLYKRFISGTPLENDIAVWMADFAGQILYEAKASSLVADSPTRGEFHWSGPLPKEAIVSACAFLEARFGKARCDNEAVSECVRCSTVAVARWLLTAIERVAALSAPSPSAGANKE